MTDPNPDKVKMVASTFTDMAQQAGMAYAELLMRVDTMTDSGRDVSGFCDGCGGNILCYCRYRDTPAHRYSNYMLSMRRLIGVLAQCMRHREQILWDECKRHSGEFWNAS